MSILPVLLTGGVDETDASSYTTPSVTPTAAPLLLYVNITGASATFNTVSGLGLTWTLLTEVAWSTIGSPTKRLRAYLGTGTPTAGQVTITTNGTATSCAWSLIQLTNADPTSVVYGSAVTDSATNPFNVPSSPLAQKDVFVSFVAKGGQALPQQEAGHTMLWSGSSAAPPGAFGCAWHPTDTQAQWTVSAGNATAGIAVAASEVPSGSGVTPTALEVATDESDASSYTTGTLSPPQEPILLFATVTGGGRRITGVSGLGLTWQLVGEVSWATSTSPTRHSTCWVGTGTPTAGQVTISVDGTATSCAWAAIALVGADQDSPVAQVGSVYSDVATSTLDVPTPAFSGSGVLVSWCGKNGQAAPQQESGHTLLGTSYSAAPGWAQGAAWHGSDAQATWTGTGTLMAGLAVTVTAAGSGQPPEPPSGPYAWESLIWGAGFQNVGLRTSSGALLSGADVAGVHRSTDAGSTWAPVNYGFSAIDQRNTAALAESPNVAGRVWRLASARAGGKMYVMRSDDDGRTWTVVSSLTGKGIEGGGDNHPRQTGRQIVERAGASTQLIIGTSDGIYLSTDTGATWSQRALAGRAVTSVVADPNDANAVYVAADSDGTSPGVYRVANAFSGTPSVTTLSSTLTDAQELLALNVGGSTRLYVAAGSDGIWEYSGGTWTNRTSGLPTTPRWCSIDGYHTGSAVRLIVGCSGATSAGAIWRSTDGGASWTAVFGSSNLDPNVNGDPNLGPWWFLSYSSGQHTGVAAFLVIDPSNPDRAWRWGRSGVWRTNNLWAATPSWHPVVRRLGVTIEWNPAIHPADETRVAVGDTDWGALVTSDGYANGQARRTEPSGPACGYAIYCVPDGPTAGRLYFAGGDRDFNQQGGVWYSDNWWTSSPTWTSTNWGISQRAMGVVAFRDAAEREVVLAYADQVGIRRKVGTGSWQTVQALTTSPTNKTVTFAVSPPYVWAYVPEDGLWRSSDHGASWERIWTRTASGRSVGYICRDPWTPTTIWLTRASTVHRITNAHDGNLDQGTGTIQAETVSVPGLASPGPIAAHPTYGVLIAQRCTGGPPALYRSTDGVTWQDIADDVWRGAALFPHGLAVTPSGKIYACLDGNGTLRGAPTQAPPLAIVTASLPDGTVGEPYSASLEATGGSPPYTWSLTSGSVPGLTLSSGGVLSGTPTTAGTFTITVRVTDSAEAWNERDFDVVVYPAPTAGGLQYGRTYYVRIVARDIDGAASPSPAVAGELAPIGTADIEGGAITAALIASGAIRARHIRAGEISADKLSTVLASTSRLILTGAGTVESEQEIPVIRATGLSRVRVVKTASQSIANNSDTTVTMGTGDVQRDTDSYLVSNSFRAPFTGQYLLTFGCRWAANNAGRRRCWAQVSTDNGSTWTDIRQLGCADDRLPTPTSPTAQSWSTVLSLSEGDRVRFRVYQDSGAALNLTDANAAMTFLGPA